jgi:hypothetical protein
MLQNLLFISILRASGVMLWEQDVAGSNPVSPTNKTHHTDDGDSA